MGESTLGALYKILSALQSTFLARLCCKYYGLCM